MRRETGRQARLTTQPRSPKSIARGDESLRAAILRAREALADGDVDLADAILSALEEDGPTERRYLCSVCGTAYEFRGLRDAHLFAAHEPEAAAA